MSDNNLAADSKSVMMKTRECKAGLSSLKDEHYDILKRLRKEEDNRRNTGKTEIDNVTEEKISAVTDSLQLLEVGIVESEIMLSLSSHFENVEADRKMTQLELRRVKVTHNAYRWINDFIVIVKDENDWLREELNETEKRLEEALAKIAGLEEEKKSWEFMTEVCENNIHIFYYAY